MRNEIHTAIDAYTSTERAPLVLVALRAVASGRCVDRDVVRCVDALLDDLYLGEPTEQGEHAVQRAWLRFKGL